MKKTVVFLCMVWLVLQGCGPNRRILPHINNQLHLSSQSGNLEGVKKAVGKGAEIDSKQSATGASALFLACEYGHGEVVQYLLDKGANINTMTVSNGATAFYVACSAGQTKMVRLLLDRGASPYDTLFNGWTPMTAAAFLGHGDVVEVLHDAGVDYNLHAYAALGRIDKVKELVTSGSDANLEGPNGLTPLFFAVHNARLDIMRYLLPKGADPNYQNTVGYSPLHDAATTQKTEVFDLLISTGADLGIKQTNGYLPLHIAAENGSTDIVAYCLKKGADINAEADAGETPLYLAVLRNKPETARFLADRGADTEKGFKCWTAMHAAVISMNVDVARMLIDHGALVEPVMERPGDLPIDNAYKFLRKDMLAFLADAYGESQIKKAKAKVYTGDMAAARAEIVRTVDHYSRKIQEQEELILKGLPPSPGRNANQDFLQSVNNSLNNYAMKTGNASLIAQTTVNQMTMNRNTRTQTVPEEVKKARAFKAVYGQLKAKYSQMVSCLEGQGDIPGCLPQVSD